MLVKKRGQPFHSHCRKGHEFTPENTIWHKSGPKRLLTRKCRLCRNAKTQARKAKLRGPKKVSQTEIRERKLLARLTEKYMTNIAVDEDSANRPVPGQIERGE